MRMSPTPSSTSTVMGLGVSKVGIMGVLPVQVVLLTAPSRCGAGRPAAGGARGRARSRSARGRRPPPGRARRSPKALAPGSALDRRLQPIGHAHVDAPQRTVVVLERRGSHGRLGAWLGDGLARRRGDHELRVATAQAQFHRARSELRGDLLGRGREGVLEVQEQRGLERRDEPLGDGASLPPPASAARSRWRRTSSTYGCRFMASLWHPSDAKARPSVCRDGDRRDLAH